MPFEIIREDITRLMTDAIVHSTNPKFKMGSGSSEAIFTSAGKELNQTLKEVAYCAPGDVILTSGYNLSAKHIIHTVGPVWKGGNDNEAEVLASCYKRALNCAKENNLKSIAFPLISAGVYGYPKDEALKVAISTIQSFLFEHEMLIYLVVYDKQVFQLSTKLFVSVKQYIDDNYVEKSMYDFRSRDLESYTSRNVYNTEISYDEAERESSFDDLFDQMDLSFSESLLSLIDKKNKNDVDTYKKANISKAHFSKIRSRKDYRPTKTTVLAFCIALNLNLDECTNLLEKAGFSLSNSSKLDLIVKYFIEQKNYDIYEINKVLFEYDQTLLGSNTL